MEKTSVDATLAIFLIAFAVVVVITITRLVVIQAIQEAQAANENSDSRNKGEQGEISSDCKRQGKDKKVVGECSEPPPPEEGEGVFCFRATVFNQHLHPLVCLQTEEECEEFGFSDLLAKGPCRSFEALPPGACVPATDGDGIVCFTEQ
jgi:hypothetical protein